MQRLAELAPTLKEAELRVLLHLAALTATSPHPSISISARQLARACGIARSATQRALDALNARNIIITRAGTTTAPDRHHLRFLELLIMPAQGGPLAGPPPTATWPSSRATPGSPTEPPLALFEGHPGPFTGPPPTENAPLARDADAVDIDRSTDVIDRLLSADPRKIELQVLHQAKKWLHGYQAKFGRQPDPHGPDDRIVAQFAAIAPWPALEKLLYDLMAERKEPGYSYAWFISVALQRIHGIQPAKLKERRAEMKLLKRGQPAAAIAPAAAPEPPIESNTPSAEDLRDQVQQLAARKSL